MATKEELQTQANAEIEAAKPLHALVNNERIEFTDAEYAQEVFEELRAEDCAPELFTRIIEE